METTMTTNNTNATTTTNFPKNVPDLKEGQSVHVLAPVYGHRLPTVEERNAWYQEFNASFKADVSSVCDGFGDLYREPSSVDKEFGTGKVLTVAQSEAFPRTIGIASPALEKFCVVLDSDTDEKWIMARRFLEIAA